MRYKFQNQETQKPDRQIICNLEDEENHKIYFMIFCICYIYLLPHFP